MKNKIRKKMTKKENMKKKNLNVIILFFHFYDELN